MLQTEMNPDAGKTHGRNIEILLAEKLSEVPLWLAFAFAIATVAGVLLLAGWLRTILEFR